MERLEKEQDEFDPKREQERENARILRRGVRNGVVGTLAVLSIGLFFLCTLTGKKIEFRNNYGNDREILNDEVKGKIKELDAFVSAYYYDESDIKELQDGICQGMIAGLGDRYSVYYNKEDYQQMLVSTTGEYYGIGAGLQQDKDTMVVTISKVYDGTPSQEAGLLVDDVVLSVDGTEGTSMEVTDLVTLIRGEEGTTVHLAVYRPSTGENL